MDEAAQIAKELGVESHIEPQREIRRRVDFLKHYLLKAHASGFVLGISGGQDSTLAGKLGQLAITELRQEYDGAKLSFTAMRLPYGTQADEADAQLALDFIQPDESLVFNVKLTVDAFKQSYDAMSAPLSDYAKGNAKARARMMAQYAYASEHNLLVIGTDHAAEAASGFFTKFGDGGADILPLSGLTKRQGKSLLEYLVCPAQLYIKAPTADLLDLNAGRTDEDELGLTYEQLDDFLEGKHIDEAVAIQIIQRYNRTAHKRQLPATPMGI
jgi:NAD+ synthase